MKVNINFDIKGFIIILMGIVILVLCVKSCDKEKPGNDKGTLVINKNEDFKNDKSFKDKEIPDVITNYNPQKDDKTKIVETDTIRRKFYIWDTIKKIKIDTVDYTFILNNPKAHKLLQMDLTYSNLDFTFQNKTSNTFNESYNLDLFNYKYRYVQGEGLSKKRDIFGRQHFEDYLFIEHDWFLNSTSLTNRLQYKTSKFIIEGGIGIDYNHIDKNLDLNIKTGIGYKLF